MKKINLKNRDLLKMLDFTGDEINYLIDLSIKMKKDRDTSRAKKLASKKPIVLIFQKTSTRTRCSFETASYELGIGCTCLDPNTAQFGKKESTADTAKVLSKFYQGIEFRGYKQSDVEELAKYADVPVWNGLTDFSHPTQMIADMMTIKEEYGKLKGLNLVFLGDGRFNIGNSLMVTCSKLGINYTCVAPKQFWADKKLLDQCKEFARKSGSTIKFVEPKDKLSAVRNAQVIYTDIWVSMGEPESSWNERLSLMGPCQVDMKTMKAALVGNKKGTIFMHCLPAYHGKDTEVGRWVAEKFGKKYPVVANGECEVTDDVVVSKYSRCFEEAGNRMHSIKAIVYATLGGK